MNRYKFFIFVTIVFYCTNAHSISNTEKAKQIDQTFLMSQGFLNGYVEELASTMAKKFGDQPYSTEVVGCVKETLKPRIELRTLKRIKSALSQTELDEGYKYSTGQMYDSLNKYILNNRLELREEYGRLKAKKKYYQFTLERAANAQQLTDNQRLQLTALINWRLKVHQNFVDAWLKESIFYEGTFQALGDCKRVFGG